MSDEYIEPEWMSWVRRYGDNFVYVDFLRKYASEHTEELLDIQKAILEIHGDEMKRNPTLISHARNGFLELKHLCYCCINYLACKEIVQDVDYHYIAGTSFSRN